MMTPRGRLRSILVRWLIFNFAALAAVFVLAYSAGAKSGGLTLLDFGALPLNAGLRLVAAAFILMLAATSLVWGMTRVLHPLDQLTSFAETLDAAEEERAAPPATNDDFGFIAEQLTRSRDQLSTAAADQRTLTDLNTRLSSFEDVLQRVAAGDLRVRAAVPPPAPALPDGDAFAPEPPAAPADPDALARCNSKFDAMLDRWCALLFDVTSAASELEKSLSQASAQGQQQSRALADQDRELAAAADSFAAVPPLIKQVADSATALQRAAQDCNAGNDGANQSLATAAPQAQRMEVALSTATGAMTGLQSSLADLDGKLSVLTETAAQANLLALNAGLELVRAGQSGRSSLRVAEQFRDLAQNSAQSATELRALVAASRQEAATVLQALAQEVGDARTLYEQVRRACDALAGTQAPLRECNARGDVMALAAARQADASRSVQSALQSASDLEKLAAQQARQVANHAEQAQKSLSTLRSALASVQRDADAGRVRSSSAAVAGGIA